MSALAIVVLSLAAWRFGHLLSKEEGPFDVFERLRYFVGVRYNQYSLPYGTNMPSKLILCLYCNSIWIASFLVVLFAFFGDIVLWISYPFAISALAIVIHEFVNR